jgi:hypothetical protein
MKNWKTTIGGFLASAGLACQASENPTVKMTGIIIGIIGTTFLGHQASDK